MRSRHVVVVSFVDGGAGMAAGTVARTGTPDVAALVAASEQAARDAGPAEDAVPADRRDPARGRRLGRRPGRDLDRGVRRLRAGPRPGVRRGARPRRAAVRLRRALDGDDVPRHAPPACGCGTTSRPAASSSTARAPTSARSVWAGAGHPRLPRRLGRRSRRRRRAQDGLVAAAGGAAGGPVRDAAAAVGRQRPDDLPLLDDGGPRRRRGPQRLRPARRRQPDRRAAGRAAADPAQRPGRPGPGDRPVPGRGRVLGLRVGVRQRHGDAGGRLDLRRRAHQPGPPARVGPADDGPGHGRRRQPDPRGPERDRRRRRRCLPPPSAGCC